LLVELSHHGAARGRFHRSTDFLRPLPDPSNRLIASDRECHCAQLSSSVEVLRLAAATATLSMSIALALTRDSGRWRSAVVNADPAAPGCRIRS
jgi:hypothetical protein